MNSDNNNLSMDGFSILPEEQQSPAIPGEADQQLAVAGSTPSARPNQKRSKNFNEKEDKLLVSAWLNISTDPVLGTNQNRGTFWSRVHEYYHSNKEFESDRSESSLSH